MLLTNDLMNANFLIVLQNEISICGSIVFQKCVPQVAMRFNCRCNIRCRTRLLD
jgi:hypothetical protein